MEPGKRITRVVIADANVLFRRGLQTLLSAEKDFEVAGEAADIQEARDKMQSTAANVLVVDLALITSDSERDLFAIRQSNPSPSILVLTREDGSSQFETAMKAGANGYMVKSNASAQIVAAMRQLSSDSDDSNPRGLSRTIPDLQALAESSRRYSPSTILTPRELEVVRLLAEGFTVREVALELALSIKTIEAHKLNLMRKLDIHNRTALIEYAQKHDIVPAVRV